ncbi:MAG: hypothetical protein BGO26_09490 [Actinobacteria bacterium 69-20]|nr:hypothetical protein [Actinomycetota bacterium]OJV23166.1 MAG: hypothetical protein BGO26_09490 [Actinobacteria bacterium 69-20]
MQPDQTSTVGPLDAATIRPARTLVGAKMASAALVAVLALALGLLLAPRVLAGVGLVQPVSARMTLISPLPDRGATAATGTGLADSCVAASVTLEWGSGQRRTARWCVPASAPQPKAGDTVRIWVLSPWSPVPASPTAPWLVFDVILLLLFGVGSAGTAYYGRELAVLAALGRQAMAAASVHGQIDRIAISRAVFGKEGRATIDVAPEDRTIRPLRLTLPGPADRSLLGARITLRAPRRTRSGKPMGPYVLVRSANPDGGVTKGTAIAGRRIALGRAMRKNASRP